MNREILADTNFPCPQLTRQHVKVFRDAGDELFGYNRYQMTSGLWDKLEDAVTIATFLANGLSTLSQDRWNQLPNGFWSS